MQEQRTALVQMSASSFASTILPSDFARSLSKRLRVDKQTKRRLDKKPPLIGFHTLTCRLCFSLTFKAYNSDPQQEDPP